MPSRVIILSGPVASGKSTLVSALREAFGVEVVKTGDLIVELTGVDRERQALQLAGEKLDKERGGAWVGNALVSLAGKLKDDARIVVDCVRTKDQIDAIREAYGPRVAHVHITASESALARRYARRDPTRIKELKNYALVRRNLTEQGVSELARFADLVIDTERCTLADVVVRVASGLGFYSANGQQLVDVLVGGQFGSEGKGNIAAYLAPEYDLLVRVGGPNAGHKVYERPEPRTFHHLPSGTDRSNALVVLGPGTTIWVPGLLEEVAKSRLSAQRLCIDPQAVLIEPEDREEEQRTLKKSIGSTAQGVGHATARKVLRGSNVRLAKDEPLLRPFIRESQVVLERAYVRGHRVLLEGTQGTGLSLHHGYYPHVTSRDTTVSGCLAEAGIAPNRVRRIVLVCRTYPIRVQSPKGGTSGPMSRQINWKVVAERSGQKLAVLRRTEKTSTTKRRRRVSEFDWALLRLASQLNGPTDIALTFADYINVSNQSARRFEQLCPETINVIEEVERVAGAPVSLVATRFHYRCVIDRRRW